MTGGGKVVLDMHEHIPSEFAKFFPACFRGIVAWLTLRFMRLFARFTDLIILTRDSFDVFWTGLKTPRVTVINTNHLQPQCASIPEFLKDAYASRPTLIHQGIFGDIRGSYQLLEAMKQVAVELPDIRCIVLGRYAYGDESAYRRAIRDAGLRVMLDPMFGVGEAAIDIVLTSARCRVASIHGRHDPLFGGRSPAPDLEALGLLRQETREGHYDLGLATDGDADRIAVVDEKGEFIPMNDLLLLIYWYLCEVRGQRGPVVRNLATTHMLDRLADRLGEQCIEVPVGFKHIVNGMLAHDAVLGGESSGGLTVRGHILGKDGVLSAALIVEMLAKTGERISTLLARLYAQVGRMFAVERNLPATPEMRVQFPRLLAQRPAQVLAGMPVQRLDTSDGFKFYMPADQWVLIRFSGTEPILRVFSEGNSSAEAMALADAAQSLLPM